MIEWLLKKLGYRVTYVCEWGEYRHRYDYLDHAQTRPIHKDMSVAPPWAKMKVTRISTPQPNVDEGDGK
jgi:hypothetical protein